MTIKLNTNQISSWPQPPQNLDAVVGPDLGHVHLCPKRQSIRSLNRVCAVSVLLRSAGSAFVVDYVCGRSFNDLGIPNLVYGKS